jgi:hypothetical protein
MVLCCALLGKDQILIPFFEEDQYLNFKQSCNILCFGFPLSIHCTWSAQLPKQPKEEKKTIKYKSCQFKMA